MMSMRSIDLNTSARARATERDAREDGWRKAINAGLVALAVGAATARAGLLDVPNGSFEAPETAFVDIRIDSWQKTPMPFWWDANTFGPWEQLTGLFLNTPPEDPRHIDNCDGNQAIFLFAVPQAGLFQDYDSTDWSGTPPSHAFDVKYEAGSSYRLTVGVIGGGGDMKPGSMLMLMLYYGDGQGNQVPVATTWVTNLSSIFPTTTHLVDFQVDVPTVKAGDAHAGKQLGIAFYSMPDPQATGGYWDLDNVRLTANRAPTLVPAGWSNGGFHLTLLSEPGLRFEILAASDISLPITNWTSLGTLTNTSGGESFTDFQAGLAQRFYQARQVP
jgi:hypothetical protein